MEFLIMEDFFSIFPFELEIQCQDRFQNDVDKPNGFFGDRVINLWNKLPYQIKTNKQKKKNNNSVKKN